MPARNADLNFKWMHPRTGNGQRKPRNNGNLKQAEDGCIAVKSHYCERIGSSHQGSSSHRPGSICSTRLLPALPVGTRLEEPLLLTHGVVSCNRLGTDLDQVEFAKEEGASRKLLSAARDLWDVNVPLVPIIHDLKDKPCKYLIVVSSAKMALSLLAPCSTAFTMAFAPSPRLPKNRSTFKSAKTPKTLRPHSYIRSSPRSP